MSATKNEPPSPRSSSPSSAGLPPHVQSQLNSHALLVEALSGVHAHVSALSQPLRAADTFLRQAAATPAAVEVPDGLAERTVAKCLTMALDGSMAGEVVV